MSDRLGSRLTISADGHLLIPEDVRRMLNVPDGGTVAVQVEDDRLILKPVRPRMERLQARVIAALPPGTNLVDELIADRRAEAQRD